MATTSFTLCMLTLAVLLATAATATVEIVNPGECGGQGQRLSSCQRYLRESSRCAGNDGGGWREEFPRCCEALENINEQPCMCQALKKVVEEIGEVERFEGRELQEMMMTAQSLPSLCRISPPRSCHNIRGSSI